MVELKNLLLLFGYVQFPEEKQRQYFIIHYSLHQTAVRAAWPSSLRECIEFHNLEILGLLQAEIDKILNITICLSGTPANKL